MIKSILLPALAFSFFILGAVHMFMEDMVELAVHASLMVACVCAMGICESIEKTGSKQK